MSNNLQNETMKKKIMSSRPSTCEKIVKGMKALAKRTIYKKVAVKAACYKTTVKIEEELFDGISLNLNQRNSIKSRSSQKRILRRIIEKRHAQAAHHTFGRGDKTLTSFMTRRSVGKSMDKLLQLQMCA